MLKLISILSDPQITFLVFTLYFINSNDFPLYIKVGIVLYLLAAVTYSLKLTFKTNKYDDSSFTNIEVKRARFHIYLLIVLLSIILSITSLIFDYADAGVFFLLLFIFNLILLTLTFSLRYKLSAHIFYNSIIIFYFIDLSLIWLWIIMILIVGYSRYKLHKHSLDQLVITSLISIIFFTIYLNAV